MRRFGAVMFCGALLLSACSGTPQNESAETSISRTQLTPAILKTSPTSPSSYDTSRIVVAAEGVVDLIAGLGFADRVVGRGMTGEQAAPNAQVVAPAHSLNAESVIALEPTLVIIDERVAPASALSTLSKFEIPILEVPVAESIQTAEERLEVISALFGLKVDSANVFPVPMQAQANAPRVAFLYLRGTSAIYLLGGKGSGADKIISAAGGQDVGTSLGLGPFTPLTPEALASTQVDRILVMTKGLQSVGGVDGLVDLPGVAQTKAAKERRIIAVEDDLLLSFDLYTTSLVTELREALK